MRTAQLTLAVTAHGKEAVGSSSARWGVGGQAAQSARSTLAGQRGEDVGGPVRHNKPLQLSGGQAGLVGNVTDAAN